MPPIRRRLAALLLALAPAAAAQAPPAAPLPEGELSVVLVTMGQGDMVWERFGHNALWIRDPASGTDWVFNYGMFDFHAPGYWGRFVKGNWLYQLGVHDVEGTLEQYRYLNRSVHAQELSLTAAQKRELQAFLHHNALPENREYLYDYFRDNCSTRVRDALDRVLGGRLRAATAGVPTGTTYRWHSERLVAGDPVSYFGLAGGLGAAADREIDRWEEMFLPFELRERVRELRTVDDAGREVPLVAREWTMYEAVDRAPPRAEPPFWTPWFLLAGLALAGALVLLGRAVARSAWARFGYAAVSGLWLAFAGVGGWVLALLWALTDHEAAYRNENLLQLSPLALPLLLLLPAAAYGARWAARPAWLLAGAVAALSVLGFALQALPGIDQRNAQILALALPVNLALAWTARGMLARLRARG
jgi:hypothetical protein